MPSKTDLQVLSEREEQVLLMSTKGLTDKEIAKKLGLSIATVNTYWVRIRTKLGGANRAELVAAALHRNSEETLTAREIENQKLIGEIVRRAEAERALRDSQERLQSIIDGSPVIIFLKDHHGRYMMVNRQFELLLGKDRKELIGKRDSEVLPADRSEQVRELDMRVLNTGETIEVEDIVKDAQGRERIFLTVRFPLANSDGSRYAVCGFSNDITDRLEADRIVRHSEERFRALIENSADMVTLLDNKGTILYVSPSVHRALGYTAEEVLGKNAFTFFNRHDLFAIKRSFEELTSGDDRVVSAEYRVRHKDGTYRWMEGVGKNLLHEPNIGALVLNYRDISARKAADEERERLLHQVQESEQRFRTLSDHAPIFIWMADAAMRHHFFNRSFSEFTGRKADELVGEGWTSIVHPSDLPGVLEAYTSAFAKHEPFEIEYRVRTKRDSYRWLYCQGTPLFGPGKSFDGFIGSSIDIEDRKRIEQDLKAANEALERRARARTIELEEMNTRLGEEVAERKRAEEDLLQAHQLTQMIIQASKDGILSFDRALRVTEWNASIERMFGKRKEDVVGKYVLELFPALAKNGDDTHFHRALHGESSASQPKTYQLGDSKDRVFLEGHFSPLTNEAGEIVGGLAIYREGC